MRSDPVIVIGAATPELLNVDVVMSYITTESTVTTLRKPSFAKLKTLFEPVPETYVRVSPFVPLFDTAMLAELYDTEKLGVRFMTSPDVASLQEAAVGPVKSNATEPVKVADPKVQLLKVRVIEFAVQVAKPFPKHVAATASLGAANCRKFVFEGIDFF